MAFSAEIRARLGLDTTTFNAQLQGLPGAVERTGAKMGQVLEKAFSFNNVFKGFMSGLGIGSALAVVNKLSTAIGDSIAHAGKLATIFDEIAANARSASEAISRVGKSEAELLDMLDGKLEKLKARRDALSNDTGSKSFFGGLIEKGSALDKLFGFSRDEEIARAEKLKKLNQEIGQTVLETAQKKETISKRSNEEDLRGAIAAAKNEQEREAAAKRLADFERERRREKMTSEERIIDLQKEQRTVTEQIGKYEEFQREGGKLTAEGISELLELKSSQFDLEKRISAETEKKAALERTVGEVIESNIAKWKEFQIAVGIRGRTDAELSDRELERKRQEIESDVFKRRSALPGGSGIGLSNNFDPILTQQSLNLERLLSEQAFRSKVRRDVAVFGEDAAFRQNPGLTEQRFNEITRGLTGDEKIVSALDRIREQLRRDQQAIAENLKSLR